jgi:hypothetical protein
MASEIDMESPNTLLEEGESEYTAHFQLARVVLVWFR